MKKLFKMKGFEVKDLKIIEPFFIFFTNGFNVWLDE